MVYLHRGQAEVFQFWNSLHKKVLACSPKGPQNRDTKSKLAALRDPKFGRRGVCFHVSSEIDEGLHYGGELAS